MGYIYVLVLLLVNGLLFFNISKFVNLCIVLKLFGSMVV